MKTSWMKIGVGASACMLAVGALAAPAASYRLVDLGAVTVIAVGAHGRASANYADDDQYPFGTGMRTQGHAWQPLQDGARGAHVWAMNEAGDAVGQIVNANLRKAAIWRRGSTDDVLLETPAKTVSIAYAVTSTGIVGGQVGADCALWDRAGTLRDIGVPPGASNCAVSAANAAGEVAVRSDLGAFLWSGGTYQALGSLGGGDTSIMGITASGLLVGYSDDADLHTHPISWKDGAMTDLLANSDVRWFNTQALAVNDAGDIVGCGYEPDIDVPMHAIFISHGQAIVLDTLVANLDGWQLTKAVEIGNNGKIVGTGYAPDLSFHSYMLVPR